ncbi:MAG: hypothetical protein RBU21_04105 [FCB group bacterium]|jgi:hypothetical protein|nr:hypothetical protein [FCB group bacterium]
MPEVWQRQALSDVTELLHTKPCVLGLAVIGSCAGADDAIDAWSDVDFVVLVKDPDFEGFLQGDWLLDIGRLYCCARSRNERFNTVRAYYENGRRYDFLIASSAQWARCSEWNPNPVCRAVRCLFSHVPGFPGMVAADVPPMSPFPLQELTGLAEQFRFKGMMAAGKVARNDLLVALHLALDMFRDCCVLAMLLRDRELGSNHHRRGDGLNPLHELLREQVGPWDAEGILDAILRSSEAYEALANRLDPQQDDKSAPLVAHVERARRFIH